MILGSCIQLDPEKIKGYKITKYDPSLYGPGGRCMEDTWTSISDIGKPFNGDTLTAEEYEKVESKYLTSVGLFAKAADIDRLRVCGLEIHDAPPPQSASSVPDWAGIEQRLRLPADYKRLVETYGSGAFDDFIRVLQPSETNEHIDLLRQRKVRRLGDRVSRRPAVQVNPRRFVPRRLPVGTAELPDRRGTRLTDREVRRSDHRQGRGATGTELRWIYPMCCHEVTLRRLVSEQGRPGFAG